MIQLTMELNSTGIPSPLPQKKRPFFLEVLCIFSWVYFFVFSMLFMAGFLWSGWVTDAINLYAPVSRYSGLDVKLRLAAYAVLFILAFSGIILIWNLKRTGFYLYGVSSITIAFMQLLLPGVTFSGTIIIIVLLILFGLYFRRFR
ncbi:MAG: hypothetical protein NTU51_03900 [Bacteroidetes bacterium]|nr:hypothetical protein [Bacteroidota bacterium]